MTRHDVIFSYWFENNIIGVVNFTMTSFAIIFSFYDVIISGFWFRLKLVGHFPGTAVRPLKTRLGYDVRGDVHQNKDLSRMIFDLLLNSFKFVLHHGTTEKYENRHPFELLVEMAQEHKNRRIKCNSQRYTSTLRLLFLKLFTDFFDILWIYRFFKL